VRERYPLDVVGWLYLGVKPEIIPVEPDLDNASEGITCVKSPPHARNQLTSVRITAPRRKEECMASKNAWKLSEVVTLVVLSVALGVLWWGWTFFTVLLTPLNAIGLNYLFVGVWFTGGTLVPFLIRKPGAALLGEVLAAIVEGFVTQWGITAAIWGLAQGLGAELIFALYRYRRYDLTVLMLAGALSGVLSWILDFFYSNYAGLQAWVWIVQVVSVIVSGALLGGLLAWLIGRGIVKTGVMQGTIEQDE